MKRMVKNHYSIDLLSKENPFAINEKILYDLATRNNAKRRFLFVSNVLGKHTAVKPNYALNISRLLAMHYYESSTKQVAHDHEYVIDSVNNYNHQEKKDHGKKYKIDEDCIFIGFAETATGLAHSIFNCFENPLGFYHTTREDIDFDGNVIRFEEEHSHATSHKIYENPNLKLENSKKIVLIDDEISTGNTLINIIKSLHDQFGIKKFSVITLLDWRNSESQRKFDDFASELGITFDVCSLIKGEINQVENGELNLSEISKHELFSGKIENNDLDIEIKNSNTIEKSVYIESLSDIDVTQSKCDDLDTTSSYNGYSGRFGLVNSDNNLLEDVSNKVAIEIQKYVSGKTLILGTEEYIYIPLKIASNLQGDIHYKSTTRSPIYPCKGDDYPINSGIRFKSFYNANVDNYVYNIAEEKYDTILIFVEKFNESVSARKLYKEIKKFCTNIKVIYFTKNIEKKMSYPPIIGSYSEDDVVFLLKEISEEVKEEDNYAREIAIQSGVHYSEMLPIEYKPTGEYLDIFHKSLKTFSKKLALAVGITAEKIVKARGENVVLVSLARAGIPAGILLKRYLKVVHNIDVAHYSISIIRGRGIDENAIKFILENHPNQNIQFVDGWTGKGAITEELKDATDDYKKKYGQFDNFHHELAVLADPGHCVELYGTREDFLIPNACLNSTVSGLLSRTVLRDDIIGEDDYHGVKYYRELENEDLSNYYIEEIQLYFKEISDQAIRESLDFDMELEKPEWIGLRDVENIKSDFDIESIHFIKPGIGETTRVLLRRLPWKILISEESKNLEHVLKLAKEKNVLVEVYPLKAYHCCGVVKELKGE